VGTVRVEDVVVVSLDLASRGPLIVTVFRSMPSSVGADSAFIEKLFTERDLLLNLNPKACSTIG
jgi:hypothetical protein